MVRIYRWVLVGSGLLMSIMAAGFYRQVTWVTDLWMWPDASRLSNIFVASILAATAAPLLWIGLMGDLAGGTAGALNLLVAFSGIAVFLIRRSVDDPSLESFGWFFLVGAAVMLGGFLYSRRFAPAVSKPTPPLVRWSFACFSVVLVIVGIALVRTAPHVFPWPLPGGTSVVYGWIFLGAAVYFAHGVIQPGWHNAAGQLLGFLAYDLVLIAPYLRHLGDVQAEHRLSLIIYLVVIVYSGVLAGYYLFVHPSTRLAGAG